MLKLAWLIVYDLKVQPIILDKDQLMLGLNVSRVPEEIRVLAGPSVLRHRPAALLIQLAWRQFTRRPVTAAHSCGEPSTGIAPLHQCVTSADLRGEPEPETVSRRRNVTVSRRPSKR